MSGAVGISRLATPRPLNFALSTTLRQQSYRHYFPCPCLLNGNGLQSKLPRKQATGFRAVSTSSAAKKRRLGAGSTKKVDRDTTIAATPSSVGSAKGDVEKRRSKAGKPSFRGKSLSERVSRVLSEPVLTDRPAYVTAPSVSASEMVRAIESSRQEAATKAALTSGSAKADLSSGTTVVSTDPFGKGADPFANQLEAAIEASLRNTSASREATPAPEPSQARLPDVQAKYLVGHARWDSVYAKDVEIKNVTPKNRPKVAVLEHGLDRVLFNPGVHWLQDPRSSVYNFDPYLRSICQPENFDYDALPAYKTSSLDPALFNVTYANKGKYMGSTSSMTSVLSQFYFLISGWKPLKTNHLSEAFSAQPKGFTRLSRAPSTIQLVHKGKGIYAIDADKTFDSSTVLMQLGKSMEKMLTSTPDDFARFTKKNSWQVSKEEREQPEAFNYIAVDKFLLRSQLDCEDPRLPGKTFDLKTRAAVAIRLDVHNYELNQGYQLRKAHGYLESFEREYYDMMRSAFLKYSLQVRIGQMDGIFVAFHNTARIFGFQYISLDEMDSRLFGTSVMGDECFKNQLQLLNRTLDEITAKYPKQDLKITVDTDEAAQSMNVWVETMPLGAASSPRGKNVKIVLDENGAPEMQPKAELSLWQIVCYSNINNVPTVGPFELSERATDSWELRYKIAELRKPYMMNEYRRMKAIQAEILSDDEKREAAIAAAAAEAAKASSDDEVVPKKTRRETQAAARTISRRDSMRSTLRRISEQGRAKQEDEERRQADKEFLVWEPKGYTKIVEPSASTSTLSENSEDSVGEQSGTDQEGKSSVADDPALSSGDSIASRMVNRLKNSAAAATAAVQLKATTATTTVAKASDGLSLAPGAYYCRGGDNKVVRVALDDLALIRKSLSGAPSDPHEMTRLDSLKKRHEWLLSSLTPFDDVRLKMLEVPAKLSEYELLTRTHLDNVVKMMALPDMSLVPDTLLRKKLFLRTPTFRSQLHVEYFRNWIHKVAALKDDAKPFEHVEDYLKLDDEEALMRTANGINITDKMVRNVEYAQGLTRKEAIKKAVLVQVYYAEQSFADEQLKALGLYPRIFDPNVFKSTRDILRGIGTKYQEAPLPREFVLAPPPTSP